MRLENEDDILLPEFRKKVIEEIRGTENKARKDEAFKRLDCFKDETSRYVEDLLLQQFDVETVREMTYALSNISIVRKVIGKLARVYSNGVKRTVPESEEETARVEELAEELDVNTKMKKTNKYLKLQKNTLLYVRPVKVLVEGVEKFTLKLEPMSPHLYDVIEDENDREKLKVIILSNYEAPGQLQHSIAPQAEGRGLNTTHLKPRSDGVDQVIADNPLDKDKEVDDSEEKKEYIWWSKSYHFTTNGKGVIISGEEIDNPIHLQTFVNFAIDQDGQFWARGGRDLVDGAISINTLITNVDHIGIVQGYGQLVVKGKNPGKTFKVGPNKAIVMDYEEGDPVPEFSFETASPPLDELSRRIESKTALLLTTNNLSTAGVSATLSGTQNFPSGIAMLIDKSESNEDVNDQSQVFIDNEPLMWVIIGRWIDFYKSQNSLVDELKDLSLSEYVDVNIKFGSPTSVVTEQEKLNNIEKRKGLGLNSDIELLMMDDPSLTEEEAKNKLILINEDKQSRINNMAKVMGKTDEKKDDDGKGDEDNSDEDKDDDAT